MRTSAGQLEPAEWGFPVSDQDQTEYQKRADANAVSGCQEPCKNGVIALTWDPQEADRAAGFPTVGGFGMMGCRAFVNLITALEAGDVFRDDDDIQDEGRRGVQMLKSNAHNDDRAGILKIFC